MRRPSFQFYPGDWTSNSNLRRCTHAEKGLWVDVMCLMHDQEEYGILRWPLKEIAQAVNSTVASLRSLVDKGILKGADKDDPVKAFVYVPRSGRKDGEPVTLVCQQLGPIWYSSRMVKDEYVRQNAGAATRFGVDGKGDQPKTAPRRTKDGSERAKLRAKVLAKTSGACHHCGEVLGDVWEIDHLHPRAKGGRHTFDNMVPSCVDCNQDKSDTLPDDWTSPKSSPTRRDGERKGDSPSNRQGEYQGDGSSTASPSSPSGIKTTQPEEDSTNPFDKP
ncbi:HNH endonuclease [Paraburkholderia gardini]|uniref:HNH endonuclease n=1 Tax=Paraburkholderia gardini TaxID=2823469 RepID=UPI001DB577DC|nr:HNH endonuclease [Paraburkholderia gardini]CAG4889450.1 hypothetical protein R69919_00746 [Paraburkholderia gardini]